MVEYIDAIWPFFLFHCILFHAFTKPEVTWRQKKIFIRFSRNWYQMMPHERGFFNLFKFFGSHIISLHYRGLTVKKSSVEPLKELTRRKIFMFDFIHNKIIDPKCVFYLSPYLITFLHKTGSHVTEKNYFCPIFMKLAPNYAPRRGRKKSVFNFEIA